MEIDAPLERGAPLEMGTPMERSPLWKGTTTKRDDLERGAP